MNKKCWFLILIFILSLFTLVASGDKEMGYMHFGSQSDDPIALMKVLASVDIYDSILSEELGLRKEKADEELILSFSSKIDAFKAMEPEIWETDEMFEERVDQASQRLYDAFMLEAEGLDSELRLPFVQKKQLIDGYADTAFSNLVRIRTLDGNLLRVETQGYDRNARNWSLSVSSADKLVPFKGIPVTVDFTTIGDEKTIKAEIIRFDDAVKNSVLQASVGWHFMQDYYDGRFMLVIDFLRITNPLTGSSYAANLKDPILIKTYRVTGETLGTLGVQETIQDSKVGIGNLLYWDESGETYTLSTPRETVSLAWGRQEQTSKDKTSVNTVKRRIVKSETPVAKDPLVFRISNGAEPESLDPALIQGVPEHRIYMSLFEGLVASDPETAFAIPGVAESWEISEDMTQYTFKLRKNAVWSDGKPITANDVVYSWLRILDPATAGPYAWFPCMFIAGAEEYNCGYAGPNSVEIRALDNHTFQVDLIGPLPYFLDALTHYSFAIVPQHAIKRYGSAWTDPANFVGNGPFTLSDRIAQTSITVIKSATYWDKANVALDKVIFYSSDSDTTNYNMYLNDELDWITNVPPDQIKAAEIRSDFQKAPELATYYYVFQNEKAPVNNPLVRKALALAIDRVALVEGVNRAGQIPAWGIVPDMAGYEAIEFPFDDQEEAIALAQKFLSDAGYPNGRGFPAFSILYNTNEAHKQIAEFIQQEWRNNLGLNVTLEDQEWQTYLSNRYVGDFVVARGGWVGDYSDPNTFLDMFVTGTGMNGGRYNNEIYDLLINESARMDASSERMSVLKTAEDIFINQDQGILPLYYYVTMNMVDTEKWGGWHTNVMDYHPVKNIYLK